MFDSSEPCVSKTVKSYDLPCDPEECCSEDNGSDVSENYSSLWSIDDDTMFYARGLKHHSTGHGKSVYVTWNENYLLNFVFKTSSKTGTSSLTKVRISMPVKDLQQEEICNMLILEMNTLLYMKSGNVYYFSSVKSMHKVDWFKGVRCMTYCPPGLFSVIRSVDDNINGQKIILCLEVYKDIPNLGKFNGNDVLRRSYDITFDFENLFNCEWTDETYSLVSLVTDENNINFLQQFVAIGDRFHSHQEIILNINQEVHIFTISGNIFILVGANVSENELTSKPNFSIYLINTYACPIERFYIDCKNNKLIVLMKSGHIDIWYKSKRMFGTLLHCQHDVLNFLDYDFSQSNNSFYFTTPEEVVKLRIVSDSNIDAERECYVVESRKCLSGMVACTFVEGLQQLVCLSINNIFFRLNFTTQPEITETSNKSEKTVENLVNMYALNSKRVTELRTKARLLDELLEQPKNLHNAIEREFRKQQIFALETKSELFKNLFQCRVEYHASLPGTIYFKNDYTHIRRTGWQPQNMKAPSIYCLIFISIRNDKYNFLSSIFTATMWYFHVSYYEQYFQFHIPYEFLNNKLCFTLEIPFKDSSRQVLPKIGLDLLTFLSHGYYSICLKYNLSLQTNEKTFVNMFSIKIQNLQVFRNSFDHIKDLLIRQSNQTPFSEHLNKCVKTGFKFKERYKLSKAVFYKVMEQLDTMSLGADVKMHYLHQYAIEMIYDADEMLTINSNYPMAICCIKLLLVHAAHFLKDVDVAQPSDHNMQTLTKSQCDIENLHASIISDNLDQKLLSMQIENLRNLYLKLRLEFNDILR